VREKVLYKDISISFITTVDEIANIFTKGLSTARFLFLQSKLTVTPSPVSLQGDVKPHETATITTVSNGAQQDPGISHAAIHHVNHPIKRDVKGNISRQMHSAYHACISSLQGNSPRHKSASLSLTCCPRISLHRRKLHILES
jgi:hypothetical protein